MALPIEAEASAHSNNQAKSSFANLSIIAERSQEDDSMVGDEELQSNKSPPADHGGQSGCALAI